MSERPTPDTDAGWDKYITYPYTHGAGDLRILLQRLERERDEAREKNAKLHDIVERAINYLDQSYRDGFSDEVSDLRYEIEQLKEE